MANRVPGHPHLSEGNGTAVVEEWIEASAPLLAVSGLPRMAGRVIADLLVAEPGERSAEQLATDLAASRGSISTVTRLLVARGLLDRHRPLGSRVDLFRVAHDAPAVLIEGVATWLEGVHEVAARGQALRSPDVSVARKRLSTLADVTRDAADHVRRVAEEWRASK